LESAGIASHRGASSANTATATLQAVPFDPARCPLSNGATATLPLPLSVPPCFIISLSTATAIFQKKKKKSNTILTIATTLPILPLSLEKWYHSNRPDLIYRLVPLPFIHCRSSLHRVALYAAT
jgi:hypothetical protein